jgi:hypothetical protein
MAALGQARNWALACVLCGLKIVREIPRGHEPLIGMILWVTGYHIALFRRARLSIDISYTDARKILAGDIRAKLRNLLPAILLEYSYSHRGF